MRVKIIRSVRFFLEEKDLHASSVGGCSGSKVLAFTSLGFRVSDTFFIIRKSGFRISFPSLLGLGGVPARSVWKIFRNSWVTARLKQHRLPRRASWGPTLDQHQKESKQQQETRKTRTDSWQSHKASLPSPSTCSGELLSPVENTSKAT